PLCPRQRPGCSSGSTTSGGGSERRCASAAVPDSVKRRPLAGPIATSPRTPRRGCKRPRARSTGTTSPTGTRTRSRPSTIGPSEQVVETALQEDADAIGVSLLSGAHNYIFPRINELMKEKGLDDVLLFGGGIIPEADWPGLRKVGVERVFPPGASLEEITTYVRAAVPKKRGVEV